MHDKASFLEAEKNGGAKYGVGRFRQPERFRSVEPDGTVRFFSEWPPPKKGDVVAGSVRARNWLESRGRPALCTIHRKLSITIPLLV